MKLIILDRDGVINFDSEHYIKCPDEWLPIPGSLAAIAKLKELGYTIAIASNQSGIARGLYTETTLRQIHEKMQIELNKLGAKIDFIVWCPHCPDDECVCRKPKTGMLQQIAEHFDCTLDNVYFVGDSASDVKAALAVKCIPILVKTGNGKSTLAKFDNRFKLQAYANLLDFVENKLMGEEYAHD